MSHEVMTDHRSFAALAGRLIPRSLSTRDELDLEIIVIICPHRGRYAGSWPSFLSATVACMKTQAIRVCP